MQFDPIDFINAGVGCNCLVALSEAGFLNKILESNQLDDKKIENCANSICIQSAVLTLEKCGVFIRYEDCYKLTEFGRRLIEYIGMITIFFDGYAGLVANQAEIVKSEKPKDINKLVKWTSVSESSIKISEQMLDPIILKEMEGLDFSGTICDLGCGHGTILSKVCKQTGHKGLGFESHLETIQQAREQVYFEVQIELADITNLQGVWDDVAVLMQAFVFHDFNPDIKCIEIMNSYLKNFPNLKYFFYSDIVTSSSDKPELFPGFDYVHGLLGIKTRTYEQTIEMFSKSNYKIYKEIPIMDLPNTFLWILSFEKYSNSR